MEQRNGAGLGELDRAWQSAIQQGFGAHADVGIELHFYHFVVEHHTKILLSFNRTRYVLRGFEVWHVAGCGERGDCQWSAPTADLRQSDTKVTNSHVPLISGFFQLFLDTLFIHFGRLTFAKSPGLIIGSSRRTQHISVAIPHILNMADSTTQLSASKSFTGFQGRKLGLAVSTVCTTGFLLFGYDQGVMSGIIGADSFNDYFPETKNNSTMQGFVTAIYEIGCLAGAIFSLLFGDHLGRRKLVSTAKHASIQFC